MFGPMHTRLACQELFQQPLCLVLMWGVGISGDLNWGLHDCEVNALLTEPSAQPSFI